MASVESQLYLGTTIPFLPSSEPVDLLVVAGGDFSNWSKIILFCGSDAFGLLSIHTLQVDSSTCITLLLAV